MHPVPVGEKLMVGYYELGGGRRIVYLARVVVVVKGRIEENYIWLGVEGLKEDWIAERERK